MIAPKTQNPADFMGPQLAGSDDCRAHPPMKATTGRAQRLDAGQFGPSAAPAITLVMVGSDCDPVNSGRPPSFIRPASRWPAINSPIRRSAPAWPSRRSAPRCRRVALQKVRIANSNRDLDLDENPAWSLADPPGAGLVEARHRDGRRADLRNANLSKVDLRCANLSRAYLIGTNFAATDLDGTILTGADQDGEVPD